MMRKILLPAICMAVIAWGCTSYYPPIVGQPSQTPVPVRTIYLDLMADGRDRREVEKRVAAAISHELPQLRFVDHPALADVRLSWSVHRGTPCVDCGDMADRGWSWTGTMLSRHGPGQVLFGGTVPTVYCCPDKQFAHQVAKYLQANPDNAFAQGVDGGVAFRGPWGRQ
jgi:hypothetical protein